MNPSEIQGLKAKLLNYYNWLGERGLEFPILYKLPSSPLEEPGAALDFSRLEKAADMDRISISNQGGEDGRLMFIIDLLYVEEFDHQTSIINSNDLELLSKMKSAMNIAYSDISEMILIHPYRRDLHPSLISSTSETLKFAHNLLSQEVLRLRPRFIICFGELSLFTLLGSDFSHKAKKGAIISIPSYTDTSIIGTYHPCQLQENPELKREVWNHLQIVMKKYSTELV